MALLEYINPFLLLRKYVRIPIEAFVTRQYLEYKIRTNKGINSVKELLYRAGIISVFVTAILWISIFMYVVFYYTYMPNVTHVRPVHLQFKSCEESMGVCSFPSAHVQLTRRSHMLMAAQPYRIRLMLDMPESQINKDLGMFMVCAQMRAKGGVLVSSSCRSAMLRHREWEELSRNMNVICPGVYKSGFEWKEYWRALKVKTKAKVSHAKRKARFSGQPVQDNLAPYEKRIIELGALAAKEPKRSQSVDDGFVSEDSQMNNVNMQQIQSVDVKVAPHQINLIHNQNRTVGLPRSHSTPIGLDIALSKTKLRRPKLKTQQSKTSPHMSQFKTQRSNTFPNMMDCVVEVPLLDLSHNTSPAEAMNVSAIECYEVPVEMVDTVAQVDVEKEIRESFIVQKSDTDQEPTSETNEAPSDNSQPNSPNDSAKDNDTTASNAAETRFECIKSLAQAVNNLAESTMAIAYSECLIATSQIAMAVSQQEMSAALQESGVWQTALAQSHHAIASALAKLSESI